MLRTPDLTSYDDWFRILVTIVIFIAWYKISVRTPVRWGNMTRLGRRLWIWYYVVLFSAAYATIDSFRAGAPITSKNYIIAFAVTGLMFAAVLRLKGDESTDRVYRIHMKGNPVTWNIQKLR